MSISQGLFLLYCNNFHMNLNTLNVTNDLTDFQLTVGSFLPAIIVMWSDRQIQGWPQFFQQKLFPSVISRSILIEWLFFEVSTTIFCMLIWPRKSLHTVFFRIFVAPVIWSILEIAFLPHPAPSPVWFNRAFIFQSLLLEFWCANTATSIAQDHLFSNV